MNEWIFQRLQVQPLSTRERVVYLNPTVKKQLNSMLKKKLETNFFFLAQNGFAISVELN